MQDLQGQLGELERELAQARTRIAELEARLASTAAPDPEPGRLRDAGNRSTQRIAHRLEGLHRLDRAILGAVSLQEVATVALDHMLAMVPCDRVSVATADLEAGTTYILAAYSDRPTAITAGQTYAIDRDLVEPLVVRPYVLARNLDRSSSEELRQLHREGIRSKLLVRLHVEGRLIGLIKFNSLLPDYFTGDLIEIALEIADQMSIAVHKAQLIEALAHRATDLEGSQQAIQRYSRRLEGLHTIDLALIAGGSAQALIDATLKNIRLLIPCQQAGAGLFDLDTGEAIVFSRESAVSTSFHLGLRLPVPSGYLESFDAKGVRLIDDIGLRPDLHSSSQRMMADGMRAFLHVLLGDKDHPYGVLVLNDATPGFFTSEHRDIAVEVSSQLTIAMRHLRMAEELVQHATLLEQRVSERTAELEAAKGRQEAILNNSRDGILLIEQDLSIMQANLAFNLLVGTDTSPRSLMEVVVEEDQASVLENVRLAMQSLASPQIEVRLRRVDGATLSIELSLQYVSGDGLVCTVHDITERKRAEVALARKHQDERQMQEYLKALHEITILLTHMETLDDFCRCTVEQALARFGFERMGFFLYKDGVALGTYGTDLQGQITDEHDFRLSIDNLSGILKRTLDREATFIFEEDDTIFSSLQAVGRGQHAAAALWDLEVMGWLVVDNGVHHRPITQAQLDILALYALTVGSLLSRKRAESALRDSEARYRLFIDSAPIAAFITDAEGVVLLANQEAEKLLGYEHEALLGQPVEVLIPEALWNQHVGHRKLYLNDLAGRRGGMFDVPVLRKDGSLFSADIRLRPVDTSAGPVIIGFIIDVTQRRQVEQALRQALAQEKELGDLKTRFVSVASHEFRTPLATILATSETLMHYRDRMSPGQVDARLQKIAQQVTHMKDIMEEVLHLARLQAGRIEFDPQPGDLNALCEEIVEEYVSQAEYRGRILYACAASPVLGSFDARLMRQVIYNLVSNALKYSPAEKSVQIDLSCDDGEIMLRVKDEGIGIPEEDLKHLFEPFHRGSNVGTISGTGLGLSITQHAVELHGGTILPEGHVGPGTTFTVRLPRQP